MATKKTNQKSSNKQTKSAKTQTETSYQNQKETMEQFKKKAASEVGVNLNSGYNGDLTSRQAGSIGGQMVKKMVENYENNLKTK